MANDNDKYVRIILYHLNNKINKSIPNIARVHYVDKIDSTPDSIPAAYIIINDNQILIFINDGKIMLAHDWAKSLLHDEFELMDPNCFNNIIKKLNILIK